MDDNESSMSCRRAQTPQVPINRPFKCPLITGRKDRAIFLVAKKNKKLKSHQFAPSLTSVSPGASSFSTGPPKTNKLASNATEATIRRESSVKRSCSSLIPYDGGIESQVATSQSRQGLLDHWTRTEVISYFACPFSCNYSSDKHSGQHKTYAWSNAPSFVTMDRFQN